MEGPLEEPERLPSNWNEYLGSKVNRSNDDLIDLFERGRLRYGSDSRADLKPIDLDPVTVETIRVAALCHTSGGEYAVCFPSVRNTSAIPVAYDFVYRYAKKPRDDTGIPAYLLPNRDGQDFYDPDARVLLATRDIQLRTAYRNLHVLDYRLGDHFPLGQPRVGSGDHKGDVDIRAIGGRLVRERDPKVVVCSQAAQLQIVAKVPFDAMIFDHANDDSYAWTEQMMQFAHMTKARVKIHLLSNPMGQAARDLAKKDVPFWIWSPEDVAELLEKRRDAETDRAGVFRQPHETLKKFSDGIEVVPVDLDYGNAGSALSLADSELRNLYRFVGKKGDYHARFQVGSIFNLLEDLAHLAVPIDFYERACEALNFPSLQSRLRNALETLTELEGLPERVIDQTVEIVDSIKAAKRILEEQNPKWAYLADWALASTDTSSVVANDPVHKEALGNVLEILKKDGPGPSVISFESIKDACVMDEVVFTGLPRKRDRWILFTPIAHRLVVLADPREAEPTRLASEAARAVTSPRGAHATRVKFVHRIAESRGIEPLHPPAPDHDGPEIDRQVTDGVRQDPSRSLPEMDISSIVRAMGDVPEPWMEPSAALGEEHGAETIGALRLVFQDKSILHVRPDTELSVHRAGKSPLSVKASNVSPGSEVFVLVEGQRQNLFGAIVARTHAHPDVSRHLRNVEYWSQRLRAWLMSESRTISDLHERLERFRDRATIRAWVVGDTIGPSKKDDLLMMARNLDDGEFEAKVDEIWDSILRVRKLHMAVGQKLGSALRAATSWQDDKTTEFIDEDLGLTVDDFLGAVMLKVLKEPPVQADIPRHVLGILLQPDGE